MSKKVNVINRSTSRVGIKSETLRFNRIWNSKGQKIQIEEDLLQDLMFEPGVANLFKRGILALEEPTAEAYIENNIIQDESEMPTLLTDEDRKAMLTTMPIGELREKVSSLVKNEVDALVEYGVQNELGDVARLSVIKKETGRDIARIIANRKADEEGAIQAR